MIKRILVSSALAAVALGAVAVRSYGQGTPSTPLCYSFPEYESTSEVVSSLSYDTRTGVSVSLQDYGGSHTATLPLTVGDEPNPHFDRVYSLLMKGFESKRIAEICVDRSAAAQIVSVKLRHHSLQKVQVCSGSRCAGVGYNGLDVYNTPSR